MTRPAGSSPKGRPTPKRRDKVRRSGPVEAPPKTRKEAAQRLRAQQAVGRQALKAGYVAGDESAMLPRDRGPVRSLLRDVVDSRRNTGVLLLPLALVLVVTQVVANPTLTRIVTNIWIAGILAFVIDVVLITLKVRAALATQGEAGRGRTVRHVGYAVLRSTSIRRMRMPPPKVEVGDTVLPGAG